MKRLSLLLCTCLLLLSRTIAQEMLVPLPNNDRLRGYAQNAKSAGSRQALNLPFADDFNQAFYYPASERWEDNYVYINNNYPVQPPTLGVATFDGLDPSGQAYSENKNEIGLTDKLTSLPIDLSAYQLSDNIYLSFYWQAGGRGDLPDPGRDYLLVEFLDADSNWKEVARINAISAVNNFEQRFIQVPAEYMHAGFQFRFFAFGNQAGNTDHWHIDYVLLDRNRNPATETSVADLAYMKGPDKYFKDYYQLPFRHFTPEMLADTLKVEVRNNFLNTVDIVDNYLITELRTGDILSTYSGPSEDMVSQTNKTFDYQKLNLETVQPADTVEIEVKFFFHTSAENNRPEFVRANNTLTEKLTFANLFSYDDGTAERAYRLVNYDFGKVAAGYRTTVPDTLRAIRIHFPNFPNFTSSSPNPVFNVVIWSSIDTIGGDGAVEIYREDFVRKEDFNKPFGHQINDFAYYIINPEVNEGKDYLLVDGNFFVGIEYEKGNDVDLGFDMNTNGQKHMFYNVGYGWYASQFPGAIMINPVMGGPLSGAYTSVDEKEFRFANVSLYPNPVSDHLNVKVDLNSLYRYKVLSMTGQQMKGGEGIGVSTVQVSELPSGIYILVIEDKNGLYLGRAKFIKQ